jgi:DNA invertase Pin-like site-specific DNA recombinase
MTKIQPTQIGNVEQEFIQILMTDIANMERKQHSEAIKRGIRAKKEREIVIRLACKAK